MNISCPPTAIILPYSSLPRLQTEPLSISLFTFHYSKGKSWLLVPIVSHQKYPERTTNVHQNRRRMQCTYLPITVECIQTVRFRVNNFELWFLPILLATSISFFWRLYNNPNFPQYHVITNIRCQTLQDDTSGEYHMTQYLVNFIFFIKIWLICAMSTFL